MHTYSPHTLHEFPHLRHSGTIPTPTERAALLAEKNANEVKRDVLQRRIEELAKLGAEAQKELADLQLRIDVQDSVLSPIRRVPPELLRDIFSLARPSVFVGLRDITYTAPWTLLGVCRYWREVCLAYGSLWGRVNLDYSVTLMGLERPLTRAQQMRYRAALEEDGDSSQVRIRCRAAELLQLQMQRSGDADLTITIQATSRKAHCSQPFLRIIVPHLHRCVELRAPSYIFAIIGLPRHLTLPRLRRFSINKLGQVEREHGDIDPVSSEEEEQLGETTVAFNIVSNDWQNSSRQGALHIVAPILDRHSLRFSEMQNITKVTLACPHEDVGTLLLTLAVLPALMDLEVNTGCTLSPEDAHPQETGRHFFPTLRSLLYQTDGILPRDGDADIILSRLEAPSLTQLIYKGNPAPTQLLGFLAASSCRLQSFHLHTSVYKSLQPDSLREILSHESYWDALEVLALTEGMRIGGSSYCWRHYYATNDSALATIFELLAVQLHDQSSESDPVKHNHFPSLLELHLRGMDVPIAPLIDILESRRSVPPTSGIARLARCNLIGLFSQRQRFSHSEMTYLMAESTKRAIFSAEDSGTVVPWDVSDTEQRYSATFTHDPLPWGEALALDEVQRERMDRLVEGGLELWLEGRSLRELPGDEVLRASGASWNPMRY